MHRGQTYELRGSCDACVPDGNHTRAAPQAMQAKAKPGRTDDADKPTQYKDTSICAAATLLQKKA